MRGRGARGPSGAYEARLFSIPYTSGVGSVLHRLPPPASCLLPAGQGHAGSKGKGSSISEHLPTVSVSSPTPTCHLEGSQRPFDTCMFPCFTDRDPEAVCGYSFRPRPHTYEVTFGGTGCPKEAGQQEDPCARRGRWALSGISC